MTTAFKDLTQPLTASKLPNVYPKGALRFRQIKLDSALANEPIRLGDADMAWFDENSTGTGGMSIDDPSGPQLPIGACRGFDGYPVREIYITSAAQSGKVLNLWWGKGVRLWGQQPAGKGQWYDRSPSPKAQRYASGGVAPHALTTRWSYTVPTLKKSMLEAVFLDIRREVVAAPVGEAKAMFVYTAIDDASTFTLEAVTLLNTVGADKTISWGSEVMMKAGDLLEAKTADLSTGGTMAHRASVKYTEFDA